MDKHIEKAPFAEQTSKTDKRLAGRTDAASTPLEIRGGGSELGDGLKTWVHERAGRELGKFAQRIERVIVRFGDDNGPKGGVDKACTVQASLSSLPPIVVEERGTDEKEAFDRAITRIERAVRRSLQRHGFASSHKHQRS